MGLAGAMVFALETDDSKGVCNQGKFPLISAIKANLNGSFSPDSLPEKRPDKSRKPDKSNKKLNRNNKDCKPLWENSCQKNSNCCSKFCEKQKDWKFGVCKNRN